MKKSLEQALIGNFGEQWVSALLASAGCMVRPVASGTDVGIDLYCETTVPNAGSRTVTPFLHFWVQVKAGKQCERSERGAGIMLSPQDQWYWERQPVPVFLALVPCDWPLSSGPKVYFADISTALTWCGSSADPAPIETPNAFSLDSPGELRAWLDRTLPMTTALLQVRRGVISNRPSLEPRYVGMTPMAPIHRYWPHVLYQQRITSANAIISMWRLGLLDHAELEHARRTLGHVCAIYADSVDEHWEVFFALGLVRHAENEWAAAGELYDRARTCILGDEKIDAADAVWSRHLAEIEDALALARAQRPPVPPPLPGVGSAL